MSNIIRLNELPDGSGNLTSDDIFVFMDNPSGSGITKKISLSQIAEAVGGGAGNANTGDITFDGIKIIGSGSGSGDGNGYSTMELVPDSGLYNNDQYLIVDPTGPNHIHLRAGGNQDDSNAEVIIGGEKNNIRVNDQAPLARMQTESLITINTYYLTSPEFSSVVWETFEGNHRVVINDPTPAVYDAVWAFTGDSLFNVIDDGANYYELTRNGSSTPGGSAPVMVYVDQAPPVNPTNLTQLTFEIRENRTTSLEANGSDVRIEAADDVRIYSHDLFRLYNYSTNDPIEIITDYDDQEYRWAFEANGVLHLASGGLRFSDDTVLSSASGIGENPFDQNLNTTDSPTFTDLTVQKLNIKSRYFEKSNNVSISSNILDIDLNNGNLFTCNLNSNITTLNIQNTPSDPDTAIGFTIIFTADGSARSVAWPPAIKWSGSTPPTLTITNNQKDVFSFISTDNGTTWLGFIGGQNY